MSNRLRAVFCDHLSIMRGKYLPASKAKAGHTRFCQSVFGTHYDRDLLPSPSSKMMEGLPDMEMQWQSEDVRESWHDSTDIVIGDLFDAAGNPLGICPRGALKRAISAWEAKGLTPKVGIELEGFVLQQNEAGKLEPYGSPGAVVYGTGPFTDPHRFNDEIWEASEELGFPIEMFTAEYDASQFEYTLTFDDALKAVDDIVLFRLMARELAFEQGLHLTFMPKPIEEAGGSGLHINFSFLDRDGNNAFDAGSKGGPDHMNDLARGCVSGLVHHHKGLAGLIAPTANSYARLQPASLSGYWQNWGGDHRNVTTRVSEEGGSKARLEHRMADASANPYTAVASVLQAALLGMENDYQLPPAETGNGFDENDATTGAAASLEEAIGDLTKDKALCAAVGQDLVDNHAFMKLEEVPKTKDLSFEAQRDFYINFI
ncbi:MAG: glutamine synthetase [Rhizobiaceae bacterium]|nr:glutamine synthetase [Rhizobiaceae bacterium]